MRAHYPLVLSLLCACAEQGVDDGDSGLDAREVFVVEQYLRLLEARRMAVDQDSLAEQLEVVPFSLILNIF